MAVHNRGSSNGRGGVDAASVLAATNITALAIEPDGVPDIQRARIIGSLIEVVRERGAARVTVAHIVTRSGVSRRTFYEMFADRDECFMAALEMAIERGGARVLPAFEQAAGGVAVRNGVRGGLVAGEGAARWQARIRAGLAALLEFLDEEPDLGGLCVVDTLSASPQALQRRAEIVRMLVDAVDAGRKEARAGLKPTRLTAEGVVGGVLGVLYARFAERDPKPMSRLLNPLMAMIVLPYLGPAASAKEAAKPAPRARPRARRPASNPLEGLDMRLTYRTMRVLIAIAELGGRESSGRRTDGPAPSNRQVADAAGVQDQGQISKLLIRLERLGLIENAGSGPVRGEPNAWRLTARGHEVERAIREQATPVGA